MSRRTPTPPRKRPAPPESVAISTRSKSTAVFVSSTSIGVLRATRLAQVVERVGAVVAGARPPADRLVVADGVQVAGVGMDADDHEAGHVAAARGGQAAGHPLCERLEDQLQREHAGPQRERRRRVHGVQERRRAAPLTLERRTGRAFVGSCRRGEGLEGDLRQVAIVDPNGMLTGPRIAGAEPAKSTTNSPSAIVTVTCMRIGVVA